jgi:hypothetical protein
VLVNAPAALLKVRHFNQQFFARKEQEKRKALLPGLVSHAGRKVITLLGIMFITLFITPRPGLTWPWVTYR